MMYTDLKEGDRVLYKRAYNDTIFSGVITYEADVAHLCTNDSILDGRDVMDKHGYEYSWALSEGDPTFEWIKRNKEDWYDVN